MRKLCMGLTVGLVMVAVLAMLPSVGYAAEGGEGFTGGEEGAKSSALAPYAQVNRNSFIGARGHAQDKFGGWALVSTRAPLPRPGMKHSIGRVLISPDVIVTGEFTDNVFKTATNETSAFLLSISPSVTFSVPVSQRVRLAVIYGAQMVRADHHTHELNNEVQYVSFDGALGLGAPRILDVDLTHDMGQHVNQTSAEGTRVSRFWTNTTTLTMDYHVGQTNLEFVYQHEMVDFVDDHDQADDMDADSFQFTGYRRVAPKTRLFLRYKHQITRNRGSTNDNYMNTYTAGVAMDPAAKVSGSLEAGYTMKKFRRRGNGSERNSGIALAGLLNYNATKKLNFMTRVFRKINETTNAQNNDGNGRSYFSSGLVARATYAFNRDVSAFIGGSFILDKYDGRDPNVGPDPDNGRGRKRDDDISGMEAGVRYRPHRIRGLALGVLYQYSQNQSNIHKQRYRENRWTLSAAYVF